MADEDNEANKTDETPTSGIGCDATSALPSNVSGSKMDSTTGTSKIGSTVDGAIGGAVQSTVQSGSSTVDSTVDSAVESTVGSSPLESSVGSSSGTSKVQSSVEGAAGTSTVGSSVGSEIGSNLQSTVESTVISCVGSTVAASTVDEPTPTTMDSAASKAAESAPSEPTSFDETAYAPPTTGQTSKPETTPDKSQDSRTLESTPVFKEPPPSGTAASPQAKGRSASAVTPSSPPLGFGARLQPVSPNVKNSSPSKGGKSPNRNKIVTPGSSGAVSHSTQSAKARLDEDLKRWRGTALKLATQPTAKPINDEDYFGRENYKINRTKEFATGQYAKLYRANHNKREMACKVTALNNLPVKYRTKLKESVRVMRYLTENMHPSVVAHGEIFISPHKLYIFMELLPGPSLDEVIKDTRKYNKLNASLQAKKWLRDVTEGVHFLYVCGIAHCNMRPENVMLYSDAMSAKLVGFNHSMALFDPYKDKEQFHERHHEFASHLAPECMRSSFRPVLADVWAIGVLLVQLLSRQSPFKQKVTKFDEQLRQHLHRHRVPFEPNMMDMLLKCFMVDPLNRIDIAGMLLHPYLN